MLYTKLLLQGCCRPTLKQPSGASQQHSDGEFSHTVRGHVRGVGHLYPSLLTLLDVDMFKSH